MTKFQGIADLELICFIRHEAGRSCRDCQYAKRCSRYINRFKTEPYKNYKEDIEDVITEIQRNKEDQLER